MRRFGPHILGLAVAAVFLAGASLASASDAAALAAPARMELTDDGPVLVTPAGATLYTYDPDDGTPGKPQCSSVPKRSFKDRQGGLGDLPLMRADAQKSCTEKWPPFFAGEHAQPVGDFALMQRPDGGKQWTYRGRPLYTSIRDHKSGDRNGVTGTSSGGVGRGFRLALWPLELPGGLTVVRRDEGLLLATTNNRLVYTPAGRHSPPCQTCEDAFKPIAAAALAEVSSPWSIVDTGAGRLQYALNGKLLYEAPEGLGEMDIIETGGWKAVAYRKGPGRPSDIGTHFSLLGDVYTDKESHTLYVFNCTTPAADGVRCDDPGDAAGYWVALCGDGKECAKRWRPYLASAGARASGEWSVIDVAFPMFTNPTGFTYPADTPRVKAWAYRGQPVYTYYEDKVPGDIWGHQIKWVLFSSFTALQVPGHSAE